MAESSDTRLTFLPLAEAAERLGLSRLKLREAIAKGLVPARRDNEGRMRVDIAELSENWAAQMPETPATPEALMEALFDEIEELSAERDEAQESAARMEGMMARQAEVLERALTTLETASTDRDRLASVTDRALAAAEEAEARAAAMQATADRALGLLERTSGALESTQGRLVALQDDLAARDAQIAGHTGQIERLFSLSEKALQSATEARRAPSLVARLFGAARDKT